ncbi:PREDICTED: apolipoprotein L2-like [Chinchilla lanigera]|uniref:Apolipoprotein L2-like n=1 Tax=Chinchilla lanigera TaxID=34839 RepID=A0A8C2W842_CHILA|nr:PREDICTED: apolipoprotein L2-like [Chinchilla lanigera]XP_005379211.1 PREDICTED: apolipoprotein L2-like [Chinchilla lanigera]XP_013367147.1 PREDICTED: apolipoprotein L2-like [Chinchilla lanigera]XP_013367148.1 PREDICTED: apolipoprotein L2-like [Chinchilla lanigera]
MATAANKACAPSPDTDSFVEVVLEHILHTLSSEDLQQLLTDDVAWEILVETTDLTREEVDAVREALTEPEADSDEDLQVRERFLNAFPHVKKELEEGIAKLYALAEKVDKVHKDCTITNVVAGSSGAVSGILTILGLALAPVTAGGSLVLSATGIGLGAAAAVTGVSASIVDHSNKLSAQAEARRLLSTSMNTQKEVLQIVDEVTPEVVSATRKCMEAFEGIEKNICAVNVVKSKPRLLANANRLMRTGEISVRSRKQVQRTLGGTVLAMSKEERITSAANAGVALLKDMYNLVQALAHLQAGAKTESAAEIRQQAQVLERKLEELIQIHESLQVDLTK